MSYLKYVIICLVYISFLSACVQAPDAQKSNAEAPKELKQSDGSTAKALDLNLSKLTFVGTKPTGRHSGEIPIKSGSLQMKENKLVGGNFILDLTNVKITDLKGDVANKLAGHLMSSDFFNAEQYPNATFEITNVTALNSKANKYNVTGNLTLKDVIKSVTFAANVTDAANFKANANFNIDRTQWGMNYGNDRSLGDKFINPIVNIGLNIVTK